MKPDSAVLVVGGVLLAATLAVALSAAQSPGAPGYPTTMGPGMMGQGMMGNGTRGNGMMGASVVRHRYVMANGIPAPYVSMRNPMSNDANTLSAGRRLYVQQCAACHGATGRGDGPASTSLSLPPSDLANSVRMGMASDAYLAWTVSEGGKPIGSPMPAFKASLTSKQIWQIVTYLRTL